MLIAWLAVACGPRVGRIEAHDVSAPDGAVLHGPLRVALLGHLAQAPHALASAVADYAPDLVVLNGDAVVRSTVREWETLHRAVAPLSVSPLPGRGEVTADRARRGFAAAWSGLGVSALDAPVTWRAFDIDDGVLIWRVVVLDADRAALQERWREQLFWVPKVVAGPDYDQLIVLANRNLGTLQRGRADADAALATLMDVVREHTAAGRLALVVTGDAETPSAELPGGRWGEAWVSTGRPRSPTGTLLWERGTRALAPGLADALVETFEGRAGGEEMPAFRAERRFPAQSAPVAGWWSLSLAGGACQLRLHLADGAGWKPVYGLGWTRALGWHAIGATPG